MPTKGTQTDSSFLQDKVNLRSRHIPDPATVLDCFAGEGTIWRMVKDANPDKKIMSLSIEKIKDKGGFHLVGDNARFLQALDLSVYNVIDLDSYGVPYHQIKILFDRDYHGLVFFTFIQTFQSFGKLPDGMLIEVGFSKEIIRKCPTLCARNGWDKFKEYLALHGVQEVTFINHQRKYYGLFNL